MNEPTNQPTNEKQMRPQWARERGGSSPKQQRRRETPLVCWQSSRLGEAQMPRKRRQDPPPPLGHSLSLLIWRWNVRYPHSRLLGRTSFLFRHTHARYLHIYKWGWGAPLRPARCPASIFPRRHGGGGGWLPTSAAPQVPHRCHATGDTVGSASGVWSICLEHSLGRGWKSPGESVRAGGGGEVLKLCWAWDPAGPRPRAPAPTPHLGAPGRRRGAGATQSRSLLVQNKARSPRGN